MVEKPALELVDQIEDLHSALVEKWDKINKLRNDLKTNYVPTSVCTHLEQCIKETEVRIFHLSEHIFSTRNLHDFMTQGTPVPLMITQPHK